MSYNSANSAFLNQSFDVTDLNNTPEGVVPESHTLAKVNATDANGNKFVHTIWKQNSFAYLRRALGPKEVTIDPYWRAVADKTTISSTITTCSAPRPSSRRQATRPPC